MNELFFLCSQIHKTQQQNRKISKSKSDSSFTIFWNIDSTSGEKSCENISRAWRMKWHEKGIKVFFFNTFLMQNWTRHNLPFIHTLSHSISLSFLIHINFLLKKSSNLNSPFFAISYCADYGYELSRERSKWFSGNEEIIHFSSQFHKVLCYSERSTVASQLSTVCQHSAKKAYFHV